MAKKASKKRKAVNRFVSLDFCPNFLLSAVEDKPVILVRGFQSANGH